MSKTRTDFAKELAALMFNRKLGSTELAELLTDAGCPTNRQSIQQWLNGSQLSAIKYAYLIRVLRLDADQRFRFDEALRRDGMR